MGVIEERLAELGLALPAVSAVPQDTPRRHVPVRVDGKIAYLSGHGPVDGPRLLAKGRIGTSSWRSGTLLTVEQGRWAARATALSMLASLQQELGELDAVRGWLRVQGFVNCGPGFNQTVPVLDGFSELILEIWGDAGRHARSAVGVSELPLDLPLQVEAIVSLT